MSEAGEAVAGLLREGLGLGLPGAQLGGLVALVRAVRAAVALPQRGNAQI